MADRTDPLLAWPSRDESRVPLALYGDPAIYAREQERIFGGPFWSYVGLAAEVPEPGSWTVSAIGERPVISTRDADGALHVLENRCAHRGLALCHRAVGRATEIVCPYHQWTYDLAGRLIGVPFLRGVRGRGGMPPDFRREDHGLRRLAVHERHGAVFASFDHDVPDFESYLGPEMLPYFDRVFDGRPLRVLGTMRQSVRGNWKLMFENIKDPYHASLLHVFLVTFGLFRADQPSAVVLDQTGRHACLVSRRGEQRANEATSGMRSFQGDLRLADAALLDPVREFPGDATVVMQTVWPNLIVQQQSNTLATRRLVTRGPHAFELHWTFFGYADDDEAMTLRRLRQANLMGPAGLVSIDDSEMMELSQRGAAAYPGRSAVLELGGRDAASADHMVTEAAVRGFYRYYRAVMEL
ncbi:MAG TPA: aromatic ring-hydroxylating dioxygenase subunit alpha [Candidatus Binatia bacterium]|nr:aromatic ring-hydroxylating dioxygenase subunit alpha [Candidatus Binatia bacterium]